MGPVKKLKGGSLAADMKMLLETGDDADLLLETGDSYLPVHRAVLSARSPVFAAMFRHDTKETREACVEIVDVEEAVLSNLVHFIYTDEVPPLGAVAIDLLAAADKYQLASLKASCEKWLLKNINTENAAAIAVLAVTRACTQLKSSVIRYMKNNCLEIIGTRGWEEAMRNSVDASVEICKLISTKVPEKSRSTFPPKWIEERRTLAGDLGKLLESGQGADVTLVVNGSQLRAHRALLSARSSVFAAMVESVCSGSVDIGDDTPEVLQQVLHFVYTDKVPSLSSMADKLFIAAMKYDVPGLSTVCETRLAKDLSVENVCAMAALVLTHICPSLRQTVMNFLKDNFMRVIGTTGWAHLLWNNPGAAIAICQFAANPSVESRTESDGERAISLKVALHDAARRGDTDKVRCLLAAGAEVEARDAHRRRTALHWASTAGHRQAARCLLRRGADVTAEDRDRRTPLHLAASRGDGTVVQLLVAAGASLNSQDVTGATPLHGAATYDSVEAVRALLRAGADTHLRDARGYTAFGVANECHSRQVIRVLLKCE